VRFALRCHLCVIESYPETAKAKSVTLAFDRQISEAGFGELTYLLAFQFGGGSTFWEVSWSRFGVASCSSEVFFLSPLHFGVASFFVTGIFLSPLHSGVASFSTGGLFLSPLHSGLPLFSFHRRSFFLAPCIFGLPLFSSHVFFSQRARGQIVHLHSWIWLTEHNS
jgi:hypothetical protein